MTTKLKEGQLASIAYVDGALNELRRAVVVTGVGLKYVEEIDHQLTRLRVETLKVKASDAPAPAPKSFAPPRGTPTMFGERTGD